MTTIKQIYEFLMSIMDRLVLLIISFALLAFLWGVLKYLKSYNNAKERAESTKFIVYGLLSLFVMTSLWGLVYMLGDSFGISLKDKQYNSGDFNTSSGGSDLTGMDLFDTVLDPPGGMH